HPEQRPARGQGNARDLLSRAVGTRPCLLRAAGRAGAGGGGMTTADLPAPVPAGAGGIPECHDDVCITCSDTAVQVRVVELRADEMAVVDTGSGPEAVSVALVSAA